MKRIIHVNQHKIKSNRRFEEVEPVLTCKTYKDNVYAHEAVIVCDGVEVGRFVYRPDKPLSCGAHVWFESENDDVEIRCIDRRNPGSYVPLGSRAERRKV